MDGRSNALAKSGIKVYEINTRFSISGSRQSDANLIDLGSIWERYGYTGASGCVFGGTLAIQSTGGTYSDNVRGYEYLSRDITQSCLNYAGSIFTEDVLNTLQNGDYRFEFASESGGFFSSFVVIVKDKILSIRNTNMNTSKNTGSTYYRLMAIRFVK